MNPVMRDLLKRLDERFTTRIVQRCNQIRASDVEDDWYRDVFAGIILRTRQVQLTLKRTFREGGDIGVLSWSARTLLELKLWACYTAGSRDNAMRFSKDMYIDGFTAHRAISKAIGALEEHPFKAEMSARHADTLASLKPKMDAAGVTEKDPYLLLKPIARDTGWTAEYEAAFVTLSKYVHATSLSVMQTVYQPGGLRSAEDVFLMGAQNALYILDHISEHLKRLGLPDFE
jgi:hypothetical protein